MNYVSLFGWMNYGELMIPALLTLLPPAIFCLGAGLMLSYFNPALIYIFMAAVLLLSALPLPAAVSLSLSGFYSQFPLNMDMLDPVFLVPGWLLVSRFVLAFSGAALAVFAPCPV